MPSPHHGNLRAELLDRAEATLRDRGVEQLSLRELARDSGVSHGAPRSHFIDRSALLGALAERGFDRLADAMGTASGTASTASVSTDRYGATAALNAAGRAYLDFATDNPALLSLMVTAKADDAAGKVHEAAQRLFTVTSALVRAALTPNLREDSSVEELTLVLTATIQGISSFVSTDRIPRERGDDLLDQAIRLFLAGVFSNAP